MVRVGLSAPCAIVDPMKTTFASDNFSGVDPAVMQFLVDINTQGHAQSYDGDAITEEARGEFEKVFGSDIDVLFVSTGTAANILGLKLLLEKPYDAVLTAETAHIYEEETGALAMNTGAQLFTLPHVHGKVMLEDVKQSVLMRKSLGEHSPGPKVLSIANPTEYGTLYSPDEIRELATFCHRQDMYLHVDGARLSNAAAVLGMGLKEITRDLGVDVLSFGGAKNGLMNAESVVIFNAPKSSLLHMQKQVMQLSSKVRYASGQFIPYLRDGIWLKNATQANDYAKQIADALVSIGVEFTNPFETNQLFCRLPEAVRERLRAAGHQFYDWNSPDELRFVTSWDNAPADVEQLMTDIKGLTK